MLGRSQEAVTLAQQIVHSFSLGLPWFSLPCSISCRREVRAVKSVPKLL